MPVAVAGGIAMLYLWLLAPRPLPVRQTDLGDAAPRVFAAQLEIVADSFADGRTLAEAVDAAGGEMKVFACCVASRPICCRCRMPRCTPATVCCSAIPRKTSGIRAALGAALYSGDSPVTRTIHCIADDQQLAEVVVIQGSRLEGTSPSASRFAERYQLLTLALHPAPAGRCRRCAPARTMCGCVGDVVLVQGPREQIAEKRRGEGSVLDATAGSAEHAARADRPGHHGGDRAPPRPSGCCRS